MSDAFDDEDDLIDDWAGYAPDPPDFCQHDEVMLDCEERCAKCLHGCPYHAGTLNCVFTDCDCDEFEEKPSG